MILLKLLRNWLCRSGWHGRVVWRKRLRSDAVRIASRSLSAELFVASGMLVHAKFIGCCQRCGHPLQWASFNPDVPSEIAALRRTLIHHADASVPRADI